MNVWMWIGIGVIAFIYLFVAYRLICYLLELNRKNFKEKRRQWDCLDWVPDNVLLFFMDFLAAFLSFFWIISFPIIRLVKCFV
jgi:hypothetical protein